MNKGILIGFLALLSALSFIFDKAIINFIVGLRVNFLNTFFKLVSDSVWIIGGAAILLAFYFFFSKKKELGWIILLSLGCSLGLGYLLKYLIGRARPDVTHLVTVSGTTSFPSTHTVAVFCLLPLIWINFKRFRWVYLMFCILMGFSRLYLGVHYLSDVLFGAFIGVIFGIIFIYNKLYKS